MITLKNKSLTSNWYVDLSEYPQVEGILPLFGLNILNNSSIIASVEINGLYAGDIQPYSPGNFSGRPYSTVRVYNANSEQFAVDDLLLSCTKNEMVSIQAYNPQLDLLMENLDRFATGCDSRVTYDTALGTTLLTWWINLNAGLNVIRSIVFVGSASIGSYSITIGNDNTTIAGGTAVNGIATDQKRYQKSNSDGVFGITASNCTLAALIIDFSKKSGDILDESDTVFVTDNIPNAHDDKLNTYSDVSNANPATAIECTFPSRTISKVHCGYKHVTTTAMRTIGYLKINDVWTEIWNDLSSVNTTYAKTLSTGWNNVTGYKIEVFSDNVNEIARFYETMLE